MARSWFLATAVALAACAPAARPRPGAPPVVTPVRPPVRAPAHPGRPGVLVGFVCPQGRPLLVASALRRETDWTSDPADLRAALARGRVHEIAVMGFAGKRAGRFTPLGPADLGRPSVTALGAYAGSAPCADEATAAECLATTGGCGLASGSAALEEAPRPPARGACLNAGHLIVDVDGDGRPEAFALPELSAGLDEVGVAPDVATGCKAHFAGGLSDGVDLLGVADLDLDGRAEVAIGVREGGGGRKALIYSSGETAARLDLLGIVTLP